MEDIYTEFENLCRSGNIHNIENYIKEFNIDINYDDNFYINLLAERGDIHLIKLIKKYNGNLHNEDEDVIHILGLYGFIDCLEYVINDCTDDKWKIMLKTNAYNNCPQTKSFVDNLLTTHNI